MQESGVRGENWRYEVAWRGGRARAGGVTRSLVEVVRGLSTAVDGGAVHKSRSSLNVWG